MTEHKLSLKSRPFNAILNRAKKIEIRANTEKISTIKVNDTIVFCNIETNKKLDCTVKRIEIYPTVRQLLEKEGTEYTLSSTNNFEEGIISIESISNYKEIIPKVGVCAIEIENPRIID